MTEQNTTPAWYKDMTDRYMAGLAHGFILHFNIRDYAVSGVTIPTFLSSRLASRTVVFYNRASGFSFPLTRKAKGETASSDEATFKAMVGIEKQAVPAAGNSSFGALAAITGQPQQGELPINPAQALPLIDKVLHAGPIKNTAGDGEWKPKLTIIITDAEMLIPSADPAMMSPSDRDSLILLRSWAQDMNLADHMVILMTDMIEDLSPAIRAASSKYEQILVPLPDHPERLAIIDEMLNDSSPDSPRSSIVELDLTADAYARLSAGLNLMQVEDTFLRGAYSGRLVPAVVKSRKDDVLRAEFSEVLNVSEPNTTFADIGGMEIPKKFVFDYVGRPLLGHIPSNRAPKGVLLPGPPGTGKTILVKALGGELGLPVLEFDLSKAKGKYVGESEKKLAKLFRAAKMLANPGIVFIDEIDQAFGRSSGGDGGVGASMFKMFLEWMSDPSLLGQIVVFAATNRPDLIDPALMRPGRFDIVMPILSPTPTERYSILKVLAGKYDLPDFPSAQEMTEIIARTDYWTGAELYSLTKKAVAIIDEGRAESSLDALLLASTLVRANTKDIAYFERLALQSVNDLDLLPTMYRDKIADVEMASQFDDEEVKPRRRGFRSAE